MKNVLIFMMLLLPMCLFAQNSLTIEISTNNNNGQVLLQLFDENHKELKGLKGEIKNQKCLIVVNNLKPGKYAFRYFHDENKNNKLDTKIGIPIEGYGFSNNAKGKFGPPAFNKWLFELKGNLAVTCSPNY